jgi:2,4-dienoyl-CoA reductase-like NADH-dependent reductase (Old Yellow Enzyme family)
LKDKSNQTDFKIFGIFYATPPLLRWLATEQGEALSQTIRNPFAMEKNGAQNSIFSPIALPCGRTIPNRLVKVKYTPVRQIEGQFNIMQVAMYEHLATFLGGPPNEHHFSLYSKWAKSDWGMIITGNVQVSPTHLTLGRDMTLPDCISEDSLESFRELASSIRGPNKSKRNSLAIMQLNHSGRQSANFIGGRYPFQRPSGPSPVPVKPRGQGVVSDLLHAVAFQTPHELSGEEIRDIIAAFVKGARVALKSGFDGIQLHAAHGCK